MSATTDRRLRAAPQSVTERLRAGRLDPEHVALAAYLGDERALATGIEPWVPPKALPSWSWPARHLIRHADLTRQQRVWLACLCAEHAVERFWKGGPEPGKAVGTAREWCEGKATKEECRAAAAAAYAYAAYAAGDAAAAAYDAADADAAAAYAAYAAGDAAYDAADAAYDADAARKAERAWQASALADCLLSGVLLTLEGGSE